MVSAALTPVSVLKTLTATPVPDPAAPEVDGNLYKAFKERWMAGFYDLESGYILEGYHHYDPPRGRWYGQHVNCRCDLRHHVGSPLSYDPTEDGPWKMGPDTVWHISKLRPEENDE